MRAMTVITMLGVGSLLCGCADEPEPAATGSWKRIFTPDLLNKDILEDRPADVAQRPDVPAEPLPHNDEAVAGVFGRIPDRRAAKQKTVKPETATRRPADIARKLTSTPQRKPVPATIPVVQPPKTKRLCGIDWHTSVDDALKSARKPGGEKPVMCFRVLGSLSGFM